MKQWGLVVSLVGILAGCQSTPSGGVKTSPEVAIDQIPVEFIVENIPRTWWTGEVPADATTLVLSCFLRDKGLIKANSPGTSDEIRIFNSDAFEWHGYFVPGSEKSGGWFRFHSSKPGIFDLDEYTILVQTGKALVYKKVFRPSSVLAQGWLQYDYLYSPEYAGKLNEHYLRALSRPTVSKASLDGSTVTVDFEVTDPRANFGAIMFYDNAHKSVARYYLSSEAEENDTVSQAAGNDTILNDGSVNHVRIDTKQLVYSDGQSFKDVGYAVATVRSASLLAKTIVHDQVVLVSYSDPATLEVPPAP